jgi:flavoprotein
VKLPAADIITCKHCGAPVALIPRVAIVARIKLTCIGCGVIFSVWPVERREEVATMPRLDIANV